MGRPRKYNTEILEIDDILNEILNDPSEENINEIRQQCKGFYLYKPSYQERTKKCDNEENINRVLDLHNSGESKKNICIITGLSYPTVRKILENNN